MTQIYSVPAGIATAVLSHSSRREVQPYVTIIFGSFFYFGHMSKTNTTTTAGRRVPTTFDSFFNHLYDVIIREVMLFSNLG